MTPGDPEEHHGRARDQTEAVTVRRRPHRRRVGTLAALAYLAYEVVSIAFRLGTRIAIRSVLA